MRIDNLRKYISLKEGLTKEKRELERRLALINEALGEVSEQAPQSAPAVASAPAPSAAPARGRRGRRPSGGLSLREAVLRATAARPLTKQEILDEVKKMGYTFTTKDPLNSLGVILYGKNPRFKNQDGRFSAVGGGGASASTGARGNGKSKGRRQMSPEARERIAAAQRARWAKQRGR